MNTASPQLVFAVLHTVEASEVAQEERRPKNGTYGEIIV